MKADFVRQVKGLRVGLGLGDSAGGHMASKGRPYRTLLVQGFEVLVGRGAEDNDYLTFQVAKPRDLWLHVAGGTAGSHVVIRNPDGVDVPREVLEVAAAAAAWYSKSRGAARVDVHYCRASDVSKPRGAPAGLVQLAKWKSLKVKPGIPAGDAGGGAGREGGEGEAGMDDVEARPIGIVKCAVVEGRDEDWGEVVSELHLDHDLMPGLAGLEQFSHAMVVYWMHESSFHADTDLVRRPRGREDMPQVGIFAQRAKHRPNPIGVTAVRIVGIRGAVVTVKGLDAIDGTPVLDVKPYVPAFDTRADATVPEWMKRLMDGYF